MNVNEIWAIVSGLWIKFYDQGKQTRSSKREMKMTLKILFRSAGETGGLAIVLHIQNNLPYR